MSWLSKEELERVLPAETSAFASPVPTQVVSSDEYLPAPQSDKQREYEARVKAYGDEAAQRLGMTRRRFSESASLVPLPSTGSRAPTPKSKPSSTR